MVKLRKVSMEMYQDRPDRYELRPGNTPGAPPCPYGNCYLWIGYDKELQEYVRFTSSVFRLLIRAQENRP